MDIYEIIGEGTWTVHQKGSKSRPAGRTGNIEGNNGEPKPTERDSPTLPKDPETPDFKKQGSDSDSVLNEEDSFKILKKILLNQKISEKNQTKGFLNRQKLSGNQRDLSKHTKK